MPSDHRYLTIMAEHKAERTKCKRALTRKINEVNLALAEDNLDNMSQDIAELKNLFKSFSNAHYAYHDTLTEDSDIDRSETYFYSKQKEYISVLNAAKLVLVKPPVKSQPVDTKAQGATGGSDGVSRQELLSLLNLPKVELEVFDGNPLRYHQFIKAFDVNVDRVCTDSDLKLSRLMQYTSSVAKEAIRGCLLIGGEEGYKEARSLLSERFGNPHLVAERLMKDLKSDKHVRSPQEIQQLSDDLRNTKLVLTQLKMLHEVNSQSTILEIVERLPVYVQNRWKRNAFDIKKENACYPDFEDLVEFVQEIAGEVNDPVYGNFAQPKRADRNKGNPSASQTSFVTAVTGESEQSMGATAALPNASDHNAKGANVPNASGHKQSTGYARSEDPCVLCTALHRLWHCPQFRRVSPKERLKIVEDNKLCHNCLRSTHDTDSCRKKSVCSIAGCGKRHTMYIHIDEPLSQETEVKKVSNASMHADKATFMPIVRVNVGGYQVNALLDTGSSNSFCTRKLADRLGCSGKVTEVQLNTLNKCQTQESELIDLSVLSDTGECLMMSDVYVIDHIPVKTAQITVSDFTHLQGIGPLPAYTSDVTVDVLIGQDNAEALLPLEIRRGEPGQPFAVRTMLGWCINGQLPGNKASRKVIANFISASPMEDVSKLWDMENEGLEHLSWSQEDKMVINLWNKEVKKVDGHYELPIPWRDRSEFLPNNFIVAKSRLDSLCKKLEREGTRERYNDEICKYVDRGYAEVVPDNEMCNVERTWYLPHHGVTSDKKPDKLRVVFDCASKFRGKSLNDRCLQGPNLINQLLPVLLRFRQHSIAIQADIESMYHQVRIPPNDRDALRFLWYVDGKLTCYRMTSHLFGGVWCASSSSYALQRTVEDAPHVSPIIRQTVEKSFYVDDCLKSADAKSDAKEIIKETPAVLRTGGFHLTKFVVNDSELLDEVSHECRAKEVQELGPYSEGRALGVKWNILADEFFFEIERDMDGPITRRTMLSIVSSIFDPLGLLGPVVLMGKLLFQEATARKLSWDQEVPADIQAQWVTWLKSLQGISDMRVPRCITPREFDYAELHNFSDASSQAYGCCTYVRCVNYAGDVHLILLISKCKVAPLKVCTIPRLELQAAVLAVKIDAMLRREMDISIARSYFWTDSEIVLKYIRNDSRRFQVFVANRISTIRELSDPDQWNYVETKQNPADFVTRPQSCTTFERDTWFNGPDFLHKSECDWSLGGNVSDELSGDDPEVRKTHTASNQVVISDAVTSGVQNRNQSVRDPIHDIMGHYSSWYRMKRCLAWWLRYLAALKGNLVKGPLTVEEIRNSEKILIRKCQSNDFYPEIQRLHKGQPVKAASRIRSLHPYLDDDGLLRVGGRLKEANVPGKHPYILSSDCGISTSIIRDVHDVAHVGVEWVLGVLRKRFWVIKARPLIKRLIRSCVTCKRLYAKPCTQLMADLPKDRVNAGQAPFSIVGVDLFGPFYVKYGRSEIKRYGCLFTCFCTRAIHLEKLDTMDTDSFLNGLRRFMSRRGHARVIYSDCGGNFVAGNSELKISMNRLSRESIDKYMLREDIEWKFNPPTASHMGGVWERMIGLVRRVLAAILPRTVRLTDEILSTVFCEAECIVNGRPLTKLTDDPNDPVPLTPNHLLMMRSGPRIPPGVFNRGDMLRRRWRHCQYLADQFWRKWLKLYLPELQKRQKWTSANNNISVGDLVLVCDELTPRNLWPLAVVREIRDGRDGLVRSIKVKTRANELVRPITKVVLLEGATD